MKTPKINSIRFILILACCTIFLGGKKIEQSQPKSNNPVFFKRFYLFAKIEDATIVRENVGKRTWYTWKEALVNELKPGQTHGRKLFTLYSNDRTIMKLDSATWELFIDVTILGDDNEKINIKYNSFKIPIVSTDSKRFSWMTNASCEAGGKFFRDGYIFEMKFYEEPQDFRFKRTLPSFF